MKMRSNNLLALVAVQDKDGLPVVPIAGNFVKLNALTVNPFDRKTQTTDSISPYVSSEKQVVISGNFTLDATFELANGGINGVPVSGIKPDHNPFLNAAGFQTTVSQSVSNEAVSGTLSTIKLHAGASEVDDFYIGDAIIVTDASGTCQASNNLGIVKLATTDNKYFGTITTGATTGDNFLELSATTLSIVDDYYVGSVLKIGTDRRMVTSFDASSRKVYLDLPLANDYANNFAVVIYQHDDKYVDNVINITYKAANLDSSTKTNAKNKVYIANDIADINSLRTLQLELTQSNVTERRTIGEWKLEQTAQPERAAVAAVVGVEAVKEVVRIVLTGTVSTGNTFIIAGVTSTATASETDVAAMAALIATKTFTDWNVTRSSATLTFTAKSVGDKSDSLLDVTGTHANTTATKTVITQGMDLVVAVPEITYRAAIPAIVSVTVSNAFSFIPVSGNAFKLLETRTVVSSVGETYTCTLNRSLVKKVEVTSLYSLNKERTIINYVGSTKTATVYPNFKTAPTSATIFTIPAQVKNRLVGENYQSLTCYYQHSNIKTVAYDMKGNISFTFKGGERPTGNFKALAIFDEQSINTPPNITLQAINGLIVTKENTFVMFFDETPPVSEIMIDAQNNTVHHDFANSNTTDITKTNFKASVTLIKTANLELKLREMMRNNTTTTFLLNHGYISNMMTFVSPMASIENISDVDIDGTAGLKVDFQFTSFGANNAITIINQ